MYKREVKILNKKVDMLIKKKKFESKENWINQVTEDQLKRIIEG